MSFKLGMGSELETLFELSNIRC